MLTKSEKFRAIIEMAASNIDSYVPSYHVLTLYANEGVVDLHEAMQGYMGLYKQAVEEMMEVAIAEEEWDETDPGPLFYVDETDAHQCFLVVETHLIESIGMTFFANGLDGFIDSDLEFDDDEDL